MIEKYDKFKYIYTKLKFITLDRDEPQYYSNPQSHVSHTSNVTQATFYLIQPQEILFEPNTSSFTQLISASFSTNLLDS